MRIRDPDNLALVFPPQTIRKTGSDEKCVPTRRRRTRRLCLLTVACGILIGPCETTCADGNPLSATEKKIVGAWSWTYIEGVGRIIFTPDYKVRVGFPPDDKDGRKIADHEFEILQSGVWRMDGDALVTEIDNAPLLKIIGQLDPNNTPAFERKVERRRIVKIDSDEIVFVDGSSFTRVTKLEPEAKALLTPVKVVSAEGERVRPREAFSAPVNDSNAAPQRKTRAPNNYYVLFSWKGSRGEYDFALVPVDREKAFLAAFTPTRSGVGGSAALKAILATLPSRSLIVWLEANDIGLRLPPAQHIDDVVSFARAKNLRVELNPTLNE